MKHRNYAIMVEENSYYPVSYTIKQDGTKVIENTMLKGCDMTKNQIKELFFYNYFNEKPTFEESDEYFSSIRNKNIAIKEVIKEKITESKYSDTVIFFEEVINSTLEHLGQLLIIKGKEYRRNGNPYHNFEIGARKENKIREEIIHGFALKHEISIGDIRDDLNKGILPNTAQVNEKFNDLIVYLLIQKASILDKIKSA